VQLSKRREPGIAQSALFQRGLFMIVSSCAADSCSHSAGYFQNLVQDLSDSKIRQVAASAPGTSMARASRTRHVVPVDE